MLQAIANLVAKGSEQAKLLAQLAGVSSAKAQEVLDALASARIIRQDTLAKNYGFWDLEGASPQQLDRIVLRRLENLPFDAAALAELNLQIGRSMSGITFGSLPADVAWGEKDDWAAREIIITQEYCTREHLTEIIHTYRYAGSKLEEDSRGAVFWLVASNEDDVEWYRANAKRDY